MYITIRCFTFEIQSATGNICGGFSDVPWTSNTPQRGRYVPSNK